MSKDIVKKDKHQIITEQEAKRYFGQHYTPMLLEIIRQEELPLMGITILGGKPYINVTGLDRKLQNLCEKKGYEFSITVEVLKDPNPEQEDYVVGRKATLTLFDKKGFQEALKKLKQIDPETLKTLKEAFTLTYTGEGWATPQSCEAIAYKYEGYKGRKTKGALLIENVIMMAERRATNRAKREATGTGLTSIDEIPFTANNYNTPQHSYTRIRKIMDSGKITEKEKRMLEIGIERGEDEGKMLDWIIGLHPELIEPEEPAEPKEIVPVMETETPPLFDEKPDRKITEKQEGFFNKLIRTHTLTQTEKETLEQAFKVNPSETIDNLQQMINERHQIEKKLGIGKIGSDLLRLLSYLNEDELDELSDLLKERRRGGEPMKRVDYRRTIENYLKGKDT